MRHAVATPPDHAGQAAPTVQRLSYLRERWPWVEGFVYVQFLWGALLFVPGAQAYRPIIRALPYASSILLLALYLPQRSTWTKAPSSAGFMLAGLGVLVANLLHPTTQFAAGVAQCVFQCMVAAPVFWAWKATRDEGRLLRIIRLVFLLNALSAGVGALQVYLPDVFLPPQFSALGIQLSDTWVDRDLVRRRRRANNRAASRISPTSPAPHRSPAPSPQFSGSD